MSEVAIELSWERGHTPEEAQEALNEFADVFEDELINQFEDLMEAVRQTVQDLAPVDTGDLRDSYEEDVETLTGIVRGTVSTEIEYAPFQEFLEYGTEHVGPAFQQAKQPLEEHAERAWNRAVRRVS